jgi:ubiquitin
MITLQVKGSNTIFDVKTKIQREVRIPVEYQALIFDGMLLEKDIITLANFGINGGSTLTLLHRSTGLVPIFIKYPNGSPPYTLRVKLSDTINNVKTNIPTIKPSKSVLIFNDTVLDDNSTLCEFDIKKGSTLAVMDKKEVNLKIFVKTLTGETKSLDVQPWDTIDDVKSFVGEEDDDEVDDEDKVLIFNETVLEDSSNVSDFDIKNGSTLTLMRKSAGRMQIFVSGLFTGKSIPLEVKHSDTILYVKSKIHDIIGIPTSEQKLLFLGRMLNDSRTLDYHNIYKGDTIDLL